MLAFGVPVSSAGADISRRVRPKVALGGPLRIGLDQLRVCGSNGGLGRGARSLEGFRFSVRAVETCVLGRVSTC